MQNIMTASEWQEENILQVHFKFEVQCEVEMVVSCKLKMLKGKMQRGASSNMYGVYIFFQNESHEILLSQGTL